MICEIQTSDLLIIIGIAAAAVLLIALIVAAAIVRRKNKRGASDAEPASVEPVVADEDPVAEEKTQPYGGTEPNACEDASGPAAAGEPEDGAKQESTDKKPVQRVRTSRRAAGSWTVEYKRLGEYVAVLCAKNGEVMLSSETYSSEEGARAGINTIVKNITGNGTFVIYRDKNDNYYFKLKTTGNKLLCVGETYRSKDQCAKAVESVRRLAPSAPVAGGLSESDEYIEYSPAQVVIPKDAAPGRWQLDGADGAYRVKLFAANGQLMLATEEVSSQRTALAAMDAVKKNAADGNFVIDRDKFGRYYYKLRNSRKSVICIGETYDSLASCVKAIETVRRYCCTAKL